MEIYVTEGRFQIWFKFVAFYMKYNFYLNSTYIFNMSSHLYQ
jgi:hypothetical protein